MHVWGVQAAMTNCLRTLELVLSQQGANADPMTKGGMAGASTALHWVSPPPQKKAAQLKLDSSIGLRGFAAHSLWVVCADFSPFPWCGLVQ